MATMVEPYSRSVTQRDLAMPHNQLLAGVNQPYEDYPQPPPALIPPGAFARAPTMPTHHQSGVRFPYYLGPQLDNVVAGTTLDPRWNKDMYGIDRVASCDPSLPRPQYEPVSPNQWPVPLSGPVVAPVEVPPVPGAPPPPVPAGDYRAVQPAVGPYAEAQRFLPGMGGPQPAAHPLAQPSQHWNSSTTDRLLRIGGVEGAVQPQVGRGSGVAGGQWQPTEQDRAAADQMIENYEPPNKRFKAAQRRLPEPSMYKGTLDAQQVKQLINMLSRRQQNCKRPGPRVQNADPIRGDNIIRRPVRSAWPVFAPRNADPDLDLIEGSRRMLETRKGDPSVAEAGGMPKDLLDNIDANWGSRQWERR